MLFLHIFGAVMAVVGLVLLALYQIKGGSSGEESTMKVWQINLSGPAPLVLVGVGALIAIFPFTSFFQNPSDPNPPESLPTTTLSQSATTLNNPDTTTTLAPEIDLPLAPDTFEVAFDEECAEDAIFWNQPEIENVSGWWLSFEAYNTETGEVFSTFEIDTGADDLTFGNVTAVCELDFAADVALDFSIWIYAYNDAGFSEPLFVEYEDR